MPGAFVQPWSDTTTSSATSGSVTVSGATANNYLVAVITVRDSPGAFTTPSGWTLRETSTVTSANMEVYERIASGDSNDDFAPSWVNNRRYVAAVAEYSGLDSTSPYEDSNNNSGASVSSLGTNSATAATADGMALLVLGQRDQEDSSSEALSTGTVDANIASGSTGRPEINIGNYTYSSTGSKSDTWSWTGTATAVAAAVLVLKEPAAGGGTRPQGPLGHPLKGAFGGPV